MRTRDWSPVSCRRALLTTPTLALLAVLSTGAARAGEDQDREDFFGAYTHRIEGVTVGAGDAPASNAAAQIIDPWPAYAQDRHILSEGRRMIGAIERYYTNSDAKPLPVPTMPAAGTESQDGAAATPAAAPSSPNAAAGE